MAYGIGPRIQIEGESEFRQAIGQINAEVKALDAEMRAATRAFEANGDEQGKLRKQSEILAQQIDKQRQRYSLLADAVSKATAKYGEDSIQATRLRGALYDTEATLSALERQLSETTADLDNFGKEVQSVGAESQEAEGKFSRLGDIVKGSMIAGAAMDAIQQIPQAILEIGKASVEAAADVRAEETQFEQAFGDISAAAEEALDKVSRETGVASTRIQGSFTQLFAFTKSVGADSASALDVSSRAMRAAADSAAYYDRSVEDVTESLMSFLKGNYENDAALGIAATETTRNTAANKLYGKSFVELSESQKVDTLLSMVEAGNAASGALGQAAREADEWTNVTGEFEEAWRQAKAVLGEPILDWLTPMIQGWTSLLKGFAEKSAWDELADSMDDYEKSMQEAKDTFDATAKSIDATAYQAEYYAKKLKSLEDAGLDTAESQNEYKMVVEALNDIMPELNLTIDEHTGLLEQDTNLIQQNIEALKEQYMQQALQSMYSEQLAAQGQAAAALATAEAQLNQLQAQRGGMMEQLSAITAGLTAEERAAVQSVIDSGVAFAQAGVVIQNNTGLLEDQAKVRAIGNAQLIDLIYGLRDNAIAQGSLNKEIAESKETVASYDAELAELKNTQDFLAESTKENADGQGELALEIQRVQGSVDALKEAYNAAAEDALLSINSQIGYFDKLERSSAMSAEEIVANWQAQNVAFDEYKKNLQRATELHLDETLVQQLSDGSVESMAILDELVNGTELSVADINAAFSENLAMREDLAGEMAEIETDFQAEWDALAEQARQGGIDIVDGLAIGIDSRAWKATAAAGRLADATISKFNQVALIGSPSKRMKQSGEWIVEGGVVGIEDSIRKFERAMRDLADDGLAAFTQKNLDAALAYPAYYSEAISPAQSVTNNRNYGGVTLQIYQQPGESVDDLADRIMDIMQNDVDRKAAAL